MPLKDKYLRYTPEITLETFMLIWDKLKSMFPNSRIYSWKSGTFDNFKTYKFISIWGIHEGSYAFGINNNPGNGNLQEATVEEILGYNPFIKDELIQTGMSQLDACGTCKHMAKCIKNCTAVGGQHYPKDIIKDEFVLPEKWCIKHSKEVGQWFDNFYYPDGDIVYQDTNYKYLHYPKAQSAMYNSILNGYTEITFDQFKKYVLKESIEKWSVGSYVVFLCDYGGHLKGTVDKIIANNNERNIKVSLPYNRVDHCNLDKDSESKWFATLQEAEEFAKTLVGPVKEEVKQPLKQAVHCTTQEEWDFACDKNDSKLLKGSYTEHKSESVLRFDFKNAYGDVEWCKKKGYKILSFQEWCDLNGYTMEKEVKFEVGKWYKVCLSNKFYHIFKHSKYTYDKLNIDFSDGYYDLTDKKWRRSGSVGLKSITNLEELSIEEIQKYLPDGHPDKIKSNQEFKVGDYVIVKGYSFNYDGMVLKISKIIQGEYIYFENSNYPTDNFSLDHIIRHATQEEINQHLISIGEIPAEKSMGEIAYEEERENFFNPNIETPIKPDWTVKVYYEPITSSEVEFNYLPEPK